MTVVSDTWQRREVALIIPSIVVIPIVGEPGVAHHVLTVEGLHHYLAPIGEGDDLGYAKWLCRFWRAGRTFIMLEDDMAPWPGALDAIACCEHDWCAYDYLIGTGHLGGISGLGCAKFSKRLMAELPDLCDPLEHLPWTVLAEALNESLRQATGQDGPHEHGPPLAHARHFRVGVDDDRH